jgi:large subunit ribosomal protein L4
MELKVINENGKAGKSMNASDDLFGREYNETLVHQLVTAYQANARSANSKQKVIARSPNPRKPFAQRVPVVLVPVWHPARCSAGRQIFPGSPGPNYTEDQSQMYRAGLASIFSQLVRDGRLSVIDALSVDAPKTKLLAQKIKAMGLDHVLIITDSMDENLYLSSRNLPNVLVVEAHQADPVSLVRFPKVLVTRGAIAKIEEMLA